MKLQRFLSLAALASAASVAMAQQPGGHPHGPGPTQIIQALSLDEQRAAVVQSIFDNAHTQMQAIHADIQKQLAAVLTAEELAKLQQSMPPRPSWKARAQ